MGIQIEDYVRGTSIVIRNEVGIQGELELVASSNQGDVVWFYMNVEQAHVVVQQLNKAFNMELENL